MNLMKKMMKVALATAMISVVTVAVAASNQLVAFDLWNANANQPSMGNIAKDNNPTALYNPTENTLQIATNPVNVSGYQSGIVSGQYDTTGNGDYVDVTILSTGTVETGTKQDGANHTVTFLSCFELEIPDYLTRTGIEYIPIKMTVPYTPMDVVVGEGYLDAKLRINWDDVTETDLEKLTPNTEISSGTVADVHLEVDGVKIIADTTMLTVLSELAVTQHTAGASFELAKTALDSAEFILLELDVTANGAATSPTGSVEIVFPYNDLEALYRINDDGSRTVLRGVAEDDGYHILSRNLGLFALVGGTKVETNTFSDIVGHWAESNILNAVSKGLFNGTSATEFSPEDQMTNGMVITVLYRMAGSPSATATSSVWYAEAMAWGLEQGIIGGYTDFDGEANVTREGLATMLYRYDLLTNTATNTGDLSAFADTNAISDWAVDGLTWANGQGIVTGKSATIIAPQDLATRAEVATMLWRYVSQ